MHEKKNDLKHMLNSTYFFFKGGNTLVWHYVVSLVFADSYIMGLHGINGF